METHANYLAKGLPTNRTNAGKIGHAMFANNVIAQPNHTVDHIDLTSLTSGNPMGHCRDSRVRIIGSRGSRYRSRKRKTQASRTLNPQITKRTMSVGKCADAISANSVIATHPVPTPHDTVDPMDLTACTSGNPMGHCSTTRGSRYHSRISRCRGSCLRFRQTETLSAPRTPNGL